ncbi:head-tail adaptor protein [Vibrio sp. H11]|uniref:head-tail adaptor protein n=1 Tax=Vibrio sp. H11 TaxID=2565928 RepID=UPI0010A6A741|nr:head-tail adaptor protein [Vibrio sp. H11]
MQAGKLNQQLVLYQLVEIKSPSGAMIHALSLFTTTKGELVSGGGGNTTDDDRERGLNQYRFRIRWRSGVEYGDWVEWRGKWLKITAVDDADPRCRTLMFDAEFSPKSKPPPQQQKENNS